MKSTVRRSLYGVFVVCATGGAASMFGLAATALPSATAASDPCAASEVAKTVGKVATNTGNYLDAHPSTNTALTTISQQPGPQALGSAKSFFEVNPQVGKDLQSIQAPLTGLSGQCKLPISIPQALQLLQGAANAQAGVPALPGGIPSPVKSLPATVPGAQNVAVPGAVPPAQTAPAAVAPAATGPLPGPSATITR